MIQLYLLSVAFLVFSALVLLVDSYRRPLSFMLKAKSKLRESSRFLSAFFISGIVLARLLLFLPMYPGPSIIGDILPSAAMFYTSFFFRFLYGEKNRERSNSYFTLRKARLRHAGFFLLSVALIHFLFPWIIVL